MRAENSKTRKPETIPLEGDLQAIIERRRIAAILKGKDGSTRFAEHVFHLNGEPIGDFRKAWASACVAAGLGKLVCPDCGGEGAERNCERCKAPTRYTGRIFHDFRRTASRNVLAAGVPQAVAMKITGHRTDSMFRRYAIVDEAQKREALAKTQRYLASSPGGRKVVGMGGTGRQSATHQHTFNPADSDHNLNKSRRLQGNIGYMSRSARAILSGVTSEETISVALIAVQRLIFQ